MEGGGATGGRELRTGEEFAGHRIEGVIGRGGMGVVYRARNLALDRDRALKVLAPGLSGNARFRERFRRESRLAASLDHPHVIPIHDAGERDGLLYIAMRLVEGRDLRALVAEEGALDPARAARIVRGVAEALDAAHAAGLVHRDVKPANVLVEPGPAGREERVFLTDFGISRTAAGGETVTASGEIVGSAEFMAPEQIAGEPVGPPADVYALGAVAYFALTSEPPFPRENELATLFAHANAPRPRVSAARPSLPEAVDAAIAHAMAIDPLARPTSAGAFAAGLEAALTGIAPAREPVTKPLAKPSRRRRRATVAVAAVAAVAVAAVAAALLAGGNDGPGDGPDGGGSGGPSPPPVETETFGAGDGPTGLTIGPNRVWVADNLGGELLAVDPRTGREVAAPVPMASPSSVAVGFGSTWAVSGPENAVYEIDADGSAVAIPVAGNPSDVAVDDESVWVAQEGEGRLARIDPETLDVEEPARVGVGPRAVAVGLGSVWVADIEGGNVVRVDPATGDVDGLPVRVGEEGSRPTDIAVGGGAVWVADVFYGNLVRIDEQEGEPAVTATIPVAGRLRGVKYAFGYAWVASADRDGLFRVDPATNEVAGKPIPVGAEPADVAVGDGSVWTANEGAEDERGGITRVTPSG